MKIEGGCHCGYITYEATIDPEGIGICHCTDCQTLSGGAFRTGVSASKDSFRLLTGQPKIYVKIAQSGARRAQAFCSHCGSPLYVYDADHPKVYGLRVGCIAERVMLVPKKQKWCRSALPWTESLAGMERHETE